MECLAEGYGLIEGPVWVAGQGLLFSDVIHGGVFCLPPGGGPVRTVFEHRRGIGGMALHASGGMIVSGRNIAFKPFGAGEGAVLLDGADAENAVGFNDLTTDPAGRLYVGSLGFSPITAGEEVKPGALFLIDLDGSVRKLASGILLTNGLGVSPDGRRLYHCDSRTHKVWSYERAGDGGLGERAPFAEVPEGLPDGLAVAEDGTVWLAVADGGCVLVFNPDGSRNRRMDCPVPMVTSLCFGGEGLRALYVVTGSRGTDSGRGGAVYRLDPGVAGLPLSDSHVALP